MADRLGIETIDREGRVVVLKFRPQANVDPVRLVSLVRQRPDLTLVPPAALKLNIEEARGSRLEAGQTRPSSQPPAASPRKSGSRSAAAPSWWTARALEGAVTPGFTKKD